MYRENIVAKKKKRKNTAQKLSSIERMLKKKADSFIKAERKFWKYRYEIEEQQKENASVLELNVQRTIPEDLASVVWALKDGVAFVRYQSPGKRGKVEFRSLNITLEKWGHEFLVVPTPQGEISLAKTGMIKGLGNITLTNCSINAIHIPYIELSHAYYDKGQLPSAVERSIIDFQFAFLGVLLREQPTMPSGRSAITTKLFSN